MGWGGGGEEKRESQQRSACRGWMESSRLNFMRRYFYLNFLILAV